MIMNITYYDKDKILSYLINIEDICPEVCYQVDFLRMQKELACTPHFINAVLEGFKSRVFIYDLNLRLTGETFFLIITQDAFDFFNRGGFAMEEDLLQKEKVKLSKEIESLEPNIIDKIDKTTTIIDNILKLINPFRG